MEFLIYYPDGDYPEFVTEIEKQTNRLTTVKKAIEPFNPNTGQYKVCFTGIDKDVDALNTRIRNHFESFVPLNDELGDDLRIKAYPILSRIEQSLRRFFSLCLPDENHFDLQRDGGLKMYPAHKELPCHPLETTTLDGLISLMTLEYSQYSEDSPLLVQDLLKLCTECTSLDDLVNRINQGLEKRSLWDWVFAKHILDKDKWLKLKGLLKDVIWIRNAVMHHKPVRIFYLNKLVEAERALEPVLESLNNMTEVERVELRKVLAGLMKTAQLFTEKIDTANTVLASIVNSVVESPSYKLMQHLKKEIDSYAQSPLIKALENTINAKLAPIAELDHILESNKAKLGLPSDSTLYPALLQDNENIDEDDNGNLEVKNRSGFEDLGS